MLIYEHSITCRESQQERCITQACFYCYFHRASSANAPTFIAWLITSFLVFSFSLSANSASSICLLAWHRYPAASWWSALLPLPSQLVSYPSLKRETGSYGAGRKDGGASIHNAPATASIHDLKMVVDVAVAGGGDKHQPIGVVDSQLLHLLLVPSQHLQHLGVSGTTRSLPVLVDAQL